MRKALRAVAALFLLALTASCSKPEDPIQVDTTAITILNQTSSDWKGVLIVVNDHYRGAAPVLKSEGRINAPIGQFETGFGQRWPPGTRITKVVVTAKSAAGEDVKLEWDINQPRQRR
jgi:hypothetical protein